MSGIASVPGRGRKPKPQETKKANGNPGKRPLNNHVPEFSEVTNIDVPEYMEALEYAPMIWKSIVPELLKNKILRITDMHNVEGFCLAYENWRKAQKEVSLNGIVVIGSQGGPIKNPALTAMNEAVRQMATLGSLLGLDPSSRARLTGGGQKKKGNAFAGVLDM
ncbi:phage terminase small subunit P27 family [Acinetobacter sp. ACNIH2]|uniref:phage terminase small subunit P27 family n=1 Tax=Acinetobacter sp. ACNIH2 TaxID=1758189 RepID=UPI000CDC1757|nr:phage terminase small subunit P27 family [Acinetobacter sp. ACNIH2]AUX84870.1 phage terminase small subunit P27 family [Acinetobacter sp. ACNIH2]